MPKETFFILGILILSGSSPPSFALNLKCINDDNTISGGTPENSCRNLLPKCSEIHQAYKTKVLEALSLKIYGYHKGWDLNTNATTATQAAGRPMPYRLCNVVGKSIQYKGARDLAFKYRGMGQTVANDGWTNYTSQQVCGDLPRVNVNKDARHIYLKMEGNSGSALASWMFSAMPYEIRAQAYDFFETVKKPSELSAALTDPAIQSSKQRFTEIEQGADQFLNALPPESKAACNDPNFSNLMSRCSGTGQPLSMSDPAIRLCSLAKISTILNQSSVSSMIQFQIMANAKNAFQQHLGSVFLSAQSSPLWNSLVNKAADDSSWWNCLFDFKGTRKCAATVVSGVMGDGAWKVYDDWWAHTTTDGPGTPRVGRRFFGFMLDSSANALRAQLPVNSSPYFRTSLYLSVDFGFVSYLNNALAWIVQWALSAFDTMLNDENLGGSLSSGPIRFMTLSSGIPAIIEKIIRADICKQSRPGDLSPRCDETLIPNKPNNGVNYTW